MTIVHPSGYTADGTRVGRHRAEVPAVIQGSGYEPRRRAGILDAADPVAEMTRRSREQLDVMVEFARIKAGA